VFGAPELCVRLKKLLHAIRLRLKMARTNYAKQAA
jgi:hypothetical protein